MAWQGAPCCRVCGRVLTGMGWTGLFGNELFPAESPLVRFYAVHPASRERLRALLRTLPLHRSPRAPLPPHPRQRFRQ